MRSRDAHLELATSAVAAFLFLTLPACGSPETDAAPEASSRETAAVSGRESSSPAAAAVCDLVLPAQSELLAAFGSSDPVQEAGGIVSSECRFNLGRAGFLKVERAPAATPSVAAWASSHDAQSSPAPEVGRDAVFVDDPLQPHVVFAYGDRVWDVGGEYDEGTPPRDALIRTARIVQGLLER